MYSSQYWYLQNHSLFKHLNSNELNEICYIAKYKTVKKGDIIFFTEENVDRVFTLKSLKGYKMLNCRTDSHMSKKALKYLFV